LILAVIYLGDKLPRYVLKNLKYLQTTFADDDVYFISDSNTSVNRAKKTGVNTWLCSNSDQEWKEQRELLQHPMHFRNGFWFKTLARLFVLDSFMQLHQNKPCLQIEADVFLFPYFPISKFRELDADIAFPMESNQMGIASLLYLRNHTSSTTLRNFILSAIQSNGRVTDMSILGQIAHSKNLDYLPLPTLPVELNAALNQPEAANLICRDSFQHGGVFDGITVGQYLLGVDAHNSRGVRILYRPQPSHAIDAEKLSFGFSNHDVLFLEGAGKNSAIYNLHNHAKDLRMYEKSSRRKLIVKRLHARGAGEQKEFILHIFLIAAFNALRRRLNDGL
jgi:hypothetical protein